MYEAENAFIDSLIADINHLKAENESLKNSKRTFKAKNKTQRNQEAKAGFSLNELAKEIHENAINHGWWEEERRFGEIIALCHSELSEALEEYRNNRPNMYFLADTIGTGRLAIQTVETDIDKWKGEKLEGIGIELADCIIRIFDYCAYAKIDIEKAILLKHEYNKTRPYKHGGKVI